jgi:hypothetical protein
MKLKITLIILLAFAYLHNNAQTQIGTGGQTNLVLYEYYNHTVSETLKLFRIQNNNSDQGYWRRGGISGRMYFVDYAGEGGSYVDFSFPQYISATQKPVITLSGASADDIEWFAYPGTDGPGREYYDVYIKTPAYHTGLSFLIRGADIDPFFLVAALPAVAANWNYTLSPQSFTYFSGNGNLGLGTLTPNERLSVNGKIRAKEIKVENSSWPDFVFKKNFALPSIESVEKHIKEKGYLPNIPSAGDVEQNGIELGQLNGKLLQKIEELTLYIIDQEKRIKALEAK